MRALQAWLIPNLLGSPIIKEFPSRPSCCARAGNFPLEFSRCQADFPPRAELAPSGALESDLVARIVTAAWRARRADRLEAALLGRFLPDRGPADMRARQGALGYGLMRDGNGPRALDTMVRYRGAVLAELFRSLAALEALRVQPRAVPGAATLLEPSSARTKRIRESTMEQ
jgi:hypothetical protein